MRSFWILYHVLCKGAGLYIFLNYIQIRGGWSGVLWLLVLMQVTEFSTRVAMNREIRLGNLEVLLVSLAIVAVAAWFLAFLNHALLAQMVRYQIFLVIPVLPFFIEGVYAKLPASKAEKKKPL